MGSSRMNSAHDLIDEMRKIFPGLPEQINTLDIHLCVEDGAVPVITVKCFPFSELGYATKTYIVQEVSGHPEQRPSDGL